MISKKLSGSLSSYLGQAIVIGCLTLPMGLQAHGVDKMQGKISDVPPPPVRIQTMPSTTTDDQTQAQETTERDLPPAPSLAQPAYPRNEPRWRKRMLDNYPPRALRQGIEGDTGLTVSIYPNGRVADCNVTLSSGSDVLDQAACKGMVRYARFSPALDANGDPSEGRYSTTIEYRLP